MNMKNNKKNLTITALSLYRSSLTDELNRLKDALRVENDIKQMRTILNDLDDTNSKIEVINSILVK